MNTIAINGTNDIEGEWIPLEHELKASELELTRRREGERKEEFWKILHSLAKAGGDLKLDSEMRETVEKMASHF